MTFDPEAADVALRPLADGAETGGKIGSTRGSGHDGSSGSQADTRRPRTRRCRVRPDWLHGDGGPGVGTGDARSRFLRLAVGVQRGAVAKGTEVAVRR